MRNPRLSNLPTPFSPFYRQPVENVSAPFVENPSQKPSPTPPKSPFPLLLSLPLDRHPNPSTGFRSMEYPVVLLCSPRGCRCLTLPRVKQPAFSAASSPTLSLSFIHCSQVYPPILLFRDRLIGYGLSVNDSIWPPLAFRQRIWPLCHRYPCF